MLFNIGKYEIVVIAVVIMFFFVGMPAMGYVLSRAGARTRRRLVGFFTGIRTFWREWRA